ncbi:MAG TPA: hypothetical protein VED01_24430 [Burkholderiales bacterium]|nr:hypothetical protein [Burkholderiales bacterium]
MSTRDTPFAAAALRISAGIMVWALHFAAIYGYTGLACARRFLDDGQAWVAAIPWVIGISSLIAAAALMPFIARLPRTHRADGGFIESSSAGLAALALVAVIFEGVTFLWLPPCE